MPKKSRPAIGFGKLWREPMFELFGKSDQLAVYACLCAIVDHADNDSISIGYGELAKMVGISRSNTVRAIKGLVEKNYINTKILNNKNKISVLSFEKVRQEGLSTEVSTGMSTDESAVVVENDKDIRCEKTVVSTGVSTPLSTPAECSILELKLKPKTNASNTTRKPILISADKITRAIALAQRWNETLPKCPQKNLNLLEKNPRDLRTINAAIERYGFDAICKTFNLVLKCPFLLGTNVDNEGEKPRWFDFLWVLNPANYQKIVEGKYLNNNSSSQGRLL